MSQCDANISYLWSTKLRSNQCKGGRVILSYFKNWTIPTSFVFIFVLLPFQQQQTQIQFQQYKLKKHRCCAWDSNPGLDMESLLASCFFYKKYLNGKRSYMMQICLNIGQSQFVFGLLLFFWQCSNKYTQYQFQLTKSIKCSCCTLDGKHRWDH